MRGGFLLTKSRASIFLIEGFSPEGLLSKRFSPSAIEVNPVTFPSFLAASSSIAAVMMLFLMILRRRFFSCS